MIEVLDSAGKVLLNHLLAMDPTLEDFLEPGQPSLDKVQTVHPRLHIPSAHPTIKAPLTIELGGHLELHWHRGYFYDFVGQTSGRSSEAINFLENFFAENVLCGVCVLGNNVLSGGPIWQEDMQGMKSWLKSPEEVLEVRSWKGSYDQDVTI
jgi:hypothetical protein